MTVPVGAAGEGKGSSTTAPAATPPCRTAAKVLMEMSESPRAPSPVAGGGL